MSLKIEHLALNIRFIYLRHYLHYPWHIPLPLIRELLNQLANKLYTLFLGLHDHHLIVAGCESPNHGHLPALIDFHRRLLNRHDPLYGHYDLLHIELDREEVDAVPTELLRAHTAQLECIVEESVHGLDLSEGQADVGLGDVFEGEFVELLGIDGPVENEVEGGTQVDFL